MKTYMMKIYWQYFKQIMLHKKISIAFIQEFHTSDTAKLQASGIARELYYYIILPQRSLFIFIFHNFSDTEGFFVAKTQF